MKSFKWISTGLVAVIGFTGGAVVHGALTGEGDSSPAFRQPTDDKDRRNPAPVCRPAVQPEFLMASLNRFNKPVANLDKERAEALLEEALATTSFDRRLDLISEIVDGLKGEHVAEAISWAERIPAGPDRDDYVLQMLGRWAGHDLQAALAYAESFEGLRKLNAVTTVLDVWQRHEPEKALAWARELPEGELRNQAMRQSTIVLSQTDPAAAVALASEVDANYNEYDLALLYNQWTTTDPAAAAGQAEQIENSSQRLSVIPMVASSWAREDFDAAMEWVGDLPEGPERDEARRVALYALGEQDPEKALKLVTANPDDTDMDLVVSQVMYDWGDKDLEGALAWADNLSPGRRRDEALRTLGMKLAFEKPAEAVALAEKMSSEETRSSVILSSIGQWAQTDPEAAVAYVDRLPDGDNRTMALTNLVYTWAANDPQEAAESIDRLARTDDEKRTAVANLMDNWAYRDPKAAAEWLRSSGAPIEPDTVQNLVETWSGTAEGKDEAASWVSGLPQGPARDNATMGLADNLFEDDPHQALEWARDIQNDLVRQNYIHELADEWMMTDEDAAERWIQDANLPDDLKRQILEDTYDEWHAEDQGLDGYPMVTVVRGCPEGEDCEPEEMTFEEMMADAADYPIPPDLRDAEPGQVVAHFGGDEEGMCLCTCACEE